MIINVVHPLCDDVVENDSETGPRAYPARELIHYVMQLYFKYVF